MWKEEKTLQGLSGRCQPQDGGPGDQVSPFRPSQPLQATPGLLPASAGDSSPPHPPGDWLEEDLYLWGGKKGPNGVAKGESYYWFPV